MRRRARPLRLQPLRGGGRRNLGRGRQRAWRQRAGDRAGDRSGRSVDAGDRRQAARPGAEVGQLRRAGLLREGVGPAVVSEVIASTAHEQARAREHIAATGQSIFARGLTFGSTGNLSIRLSDGSLLLTPTNVSMGALDPARLALIDAEGNHVSGDRPTKEAFLHATMYAARRKAGAVVHLHSTHSVAVSCLADIDRSDVMPPLTAYYIMRVGRLPLVDYFPPGDPDLAKAVGKLAGAHHAVLLANHGPVVAGRDMDAALYATEELEETAKLFLMLQGMKTRPLTDAQVEKLRARFAT
ncbi:MAG: aldolase [Rhodobiaceae bacterium]|nr:aldolase [Rhodobiaceae bacterium]